MKLKHITIIAAILAAATAQAQDRGIHINTRDGRVILEQDRCPKTGKQATFIESKSNGGGAYGCWYVWNDNVYVAWHTFMGANGSVLHGNTIMTYPAPPELRQ
jgi:hypothetical protein